MLLSVNKKSSKLAVLSELGPYPMFINALLLTLKYEHSLIRSQESDSLAKLTMDEMSDLA